MQRPTSKYKFFLTCLHVLFFFLMMFCTTHFNRNSYLRILNMQLFLASLHFTLSFKCYDRVDALIMLMLERNIY